MGLPEWHKVDLLHESWKQSKITHYGTRIHQFPRFDSANDRFRRRFCTNLEELQRYDKSRSDFTHSLAGAGRCATRNQDFQWYIFKIRL